MPPDAMLPDGSVADYWMDRPPPPPAAGRDWTSSPDLREAALKHEIARLTRERNRLLALGAGARSPSAALARDAGDHAARLAAKDRLIRALYASRSWRLSAPLRAVSGLLGRPDTPPVDRAIAETDAAGDLAMMRLADLPIVPSVRQRPLGRSRGEVVVTDHLMMPRTSTGESLTCGSLILGMPFMGAVSRSAIVAPAAVRPSSWFGFRMGGSGR